MKKKIAIALDGSVYCSHAIRYAAALAPLLPELNFVLLNIQPAVSQYLIQDAERQSHMRVALENLLAANEKSSRQMLEKARAQLVQGGVAPEAIELRTRVRINGVAQDILDTCQTLQHDAILVGRRGLGRIQELITGSVTANLLAHSQWTPIWMVDGEVAHAKILLASDGSPNALRALDHLAFMLSGNSQAVLQVVYVKPRLHDLLGFDLDKETRAATEAAFTSGAIQNIDIFKENAKQIVLKNGLHEQQLQVMSIESRLTVAGTILDAAREGGFGTIVVGRSSAARSLFAGSVARKILQKASGSAVWWVP